MQNQADIKIDQLKQRWLQKDSNGNTRKEEILNQLQGPKDQKEREKDLRGIDLINEELGNSDFSHCDLSYADFTGANLEKSNFSFSKLHDTTFFKAKLCHCEFLSSNIQGANFNECISRNAGFGASKINNSTFFQSNLEASTLSNAEITFSDFRAANLTSCHIRNSNLKGTNFQHAKVQHCDLTESILENARFIETDLRDSKFSHIQKYEKAYWIGADIRNVDFCGAYMVRRHIVDENYLYEFKNRSTWHLYLYRLWLITSDCGRSFVRWGIWTVCVAIFFAIIYTRVEMNYEVPKNFFSPFYFSIVTMTTLGYGDVTPSTLVGQVLSVIQVMIGYVALGGLIGIFANKMSRRGE